MSSIIALVFDFDDTLAHDSTSTFLEGIGLDVKKFWREHLERLRAGWDPVPAYLQMMLEESMRRPRGDRITKQRLQRAGAKISFHAGVRGIFRRVRAQVRRLGDGVSLECYVVSSGIGEVVRRCAIAAEFNEIWASDFAYGSGGEIVAIKNVVSFTDKTRFIFQISKGIGANSAQRDPFAVNRRVETSAIRIPLSQMIMVGDGYTDVPCFSLVQRHGGIAIGVYDRTSRERWGKAWGFLEDNRVKHIVAADYRKQRGLDDALSLAIDKIATDINLRRITYQG